MRIAFVETLTALAKKDPRIMLLTGDLGYSVFEEYIKTVPDQYINAGIAEQNMTGVAAGLAMEGKIPVIYSIVPFVTMRNFEQIRNDICYQDLNVKIVGVGAGFSYGPYGHTHHGLEDIGILRTLPNITIFCPGDPVEAYLVTEAALSLSGPVYIRIGKKGEPVLHKKKPLFKIGKGIVMVRGKDITIVATSTMLETAVKVSHLLKQKKITSTLISMPSIKPFNQQSIISHTKKTGRIITIEEHSIIGGLGSVVAEILAESNLIYSFKRFGVADRFTKVIGYQEHMRKANGLLPEQITLEIKKLFFS